MEYWFQPVGSPDLSGIKAKQFTYWDYIIACQPDKSGYSSRINSAFQIIQCSISLKAKKPSL
jgi:hypothetical protein